MCERRSVLHGEHSRQEVPDATLAELRLAALTKLELSNTEIAAMLGISPESMVKTRYRLKKKLGGNGIGGSGGGFKIAQIGFG